MGCLNIAVVIGVKRDGAIDVLHAGKPSDVPEVRKQSRRLHAEYGEIRTFYIPSIVEKTRSDLPALLETAIPSLIEDPKGDKSGKKDGLVGGLLSKLTRK